MGFYDQCEQGLYFISSMDGDIPRVYDLSDGSLLYYSRGYIERQIWTKHKGKSLIPE
jgi:hypothetical protein